ncbi:5075_t:CDS:10 [Entrophospora sp. SA101]|nr:5075_t:CDS:10 [Entrophospora sp. SA101]
MSLFDQVKEQSINCLIKVYINILGLVYKSRVYINSFERAYECLDVSEHSSSSNFNNISNNPSGIFGFSTVTGREIDPLSKESMEKVYKFLDVPTDLSSPSTNFNNISNNPSGISGFSTGSGRGINPVSKESMEKAYKCLDIPAQSSSPSINSNNISNNTLGISRFSTGSRRGINPVSKESTEEAYKHLDVSEQSSSNIRPLKDNDIKKFRKPIKSATISSSINNNNNDDDDNISTKFFELSSSVPRNTMGNLVYHHPLKFTEQNLLNFEIPTDVLYINPSNATHYSFVWPRLFSKSDSQLQQKTWDPNEALSCLIEYGANPKLIDEQWVLDHYKWIVWKITILDQLRYRYEREINCAHRSSIKLIVEGDTSPSWPIVLCVSNIIDDKIPIDSKFSLELTDGWYKIHTCIDPPLQRAIMKSKIKIGSKLEICGAKVYGESVGKTSVLEATNSIYLKLSGNSTKPAHWNSKLGFGKFRPFALLNSLTPDGGFIFAIDVVVMRKYPLMYRETTKDGIYIMRNEKGEELAQRKFTEQMQEKVLSLLEIYHKVGIGGDDSANNNIRQKQAITKQFVNSLTSGEEIFNLLHENIEDSNRIFEYLSSDQIRWLNDWLNRKTISDLNEKNDWLNEQLESMDLKCVRSVVPFFKVRVCDYHETVREVRSRVKREALITIWSPSSSLYDSICEGQRNHIYSLMVANNQSYDPSLSTTIPLIRINPVSKESMEKAYKCLDVPTNLSSPSTNSNNNPSGIFGFSTGSGREINPLSKESIEKAYKFLDIPTDLSSPSTNFNNISNNPSGISGFSTGSGKGINPVSKESMEKAYKCLDVPTDLSSPSTNSNNISNNPSGIPGFSTGSGREINPVSKESMEKAYKCLDVPTHSLLPSINSNNISNNILGISGFSTGSGRGINPISKESMEEAYKHLDVSEQSSSNIRPLKDNDIKNNIKKSKKNRHSIKYDSNIYKSPSIKSSHQSNLKSRTPLKSLHSLQNIKNSSPQSNKNNDNNKKKYKKNIKSSSLSSQTTISSSINNNDDDDNNIGTKFFELSSSVPRNVMGNLVYHHPLKFTEQNLLNFEIPTDALYINPSNATHYRFTWPRLFSKSDSQPQQKTWGPNEALSCLIECGANPKLIDEQWVLNHYKWIVWKITSMIRSYPYLFRDWLSSDTVLDQLRYRYEREINRAHRSSIKLIVEGDTSPSWPIVLCVSNIIDDKIPIDSKLSLELTDGWYKIHACIDPPLQRAIMKSKIKIGSKLEICGAKVYGESVGKTSVLEATNSIYLKLSGNSTKPAHWDSKLGFGKFRPFASLNSLTPDGGFIFAIDVVVMRKYPLMYRETTKDGIYIMRNEKGEELAQRKFTEQMQEKVLSLLEIYHKVGIGGDDSANNNIRQKQAITKQYVNSLTSGEEIFNLLHENTEDSNRIFEYLSSDQIRWLNDWLNRKKIRDLNEKNDWLNEQLESMDLKCVRSVVPFFKVRVCDYHETVGEVQSRVKREALITIWSPSSSLYDSIREGQRNHIYSLMNTNYKRVLTNSINNNFPKKEQLLKAKHDWVAVHVSVRIPIIKTSERSERILSDAKSKEHSRIQKTTCQVRFEENMSHENKYKSILKDWWKISTTMMVVVIDTTSEESDDITLVEFNSYEIKNKISNVICDNIQNEELDPQDLLPNGIINHTFLQNYHKRLFDLIVKQNCLNELLWSRVELHRYKMKLAIEEKNFICSHIKYGNCTAPNG